MKNKLLLLFFICVLVCTEKAESVKRLIPRHRIVNESPYSVVAKIIQGKKITCKQERTWEIAPGKDKEFFMREECLPYRFYLSIKENIPFIIGKKKNLIIELPILERTPNPLIKANYIYWTIVVKGKQAPLSITKTPLVYTSRFARRALKYRDAQH